MVMKWQSVLLSLLPTLHLLAIIKHFVYTDGPWFYGFDLNEFLTTMVQKQYTH